MALNLTRRGFTKLSAATLAAGAMVGAGAQTALADAAPSISDDNGVRKVRSCCRACGKMECGVIVTIQDGKVVRVEGDESAFQSEGNCCAKSQSSMQAAYHPDRLRYPMKRVNPKDQDGGWQRISWDEAWDIVSEKFHEIVDKYGGQSNMCLSGTSRMWAHGSDGSIPMALGTNNVHCAFQICKGPVFSRAPSPTTSACSGTRAS